MLLFLLCHAPSADLCSPGFWWQSLCAGEDLSRRPEQSSKIRKGEPQAPGLPQPWLGDAGVEGDERRAIECASFQSLASAQKAKPEPVRPRNRGLQRYSSACKAFACRHCGSSSGVRLTRSCCEGARPRLYNGKTHRPSPSEARGFVPGSLVGVLLNNACKTHAMIGENASKRTAVLPRSSVRVSSDYCTLTLYLRRCVRRSQRQISSWVDGLGDGLR